MTDAIIPPPAGPNDYGALPPPVDEEIYGEDGGQYGATEPRPATEASRNSGTSTGSKYFHISELAALPPPSFLIDGLYVEKTFNLHYGPPKSGKTHITSQISYDLALGTPHFGRNVRRTGTLILAGEGADAIGLRARAFAQHHGADLRDMDIGILTSRIDLLSEDQTGTVDSILRCYEKLKNPGAIQIDPGASSCAAATKARRWTWAARSKPPAS